MSLVRRRQFLVAMLGLLVAPPARAQQRAKPVRIGVLGVNKLNLRTAFWKPLFTELAQLGWHEGVEYSLLVKEADGDPAEVTTLAGELVAAQIDMVFAISTGAALAAMRASDRIPIVCWCGYPVEAGLAISLARPGGRVTGVANYANAGVWGKFVELLRDVRPGLTELGALIDYAPPAFPDGPVASLEIERTAKQAGINCRLWKVRSEHDLTEALATVDGGPTEALVISSGGGVHYRPPAMERIRELIARRRLVAITDIAAGFFVNSGCVLAYSPESEHLLARLAYQIDRILRGANPGELPFELPSRFDLVINAKAAKAIDLTIPQSVLIRADRIIE